MESITKPAQVLQPPENSILHPVEAYLDRRCAQEPVHLVQYDTGIPVLTVALFQKDKPYAVPAGAAVNLRLSKPDGTCVYDPVLGLSQDRQTVYVQVSRQMTAAAGLANAILEIILNGGVVGTASFLLFLAAHPVTDEAILSSGEFKSLDEYVSQAEAAAQAAAQSREASANSASDAKESEVRAAGSAAAAKESADAAENSAGRAAERTEQADRSAGAAAASAQEAKESARSVQDMARAAQSYAVGGTKMRENEDVDNARYYYDQAKRISQGLNGALLPMGTVRFEELSFQTKQAGYMYNISDAFTTDGTFKEGSGHAYPAGTNVYRTADGFWDCLAGAQVVSVNGRTGAVTLTKADVGLDKVDNTPDNAKNVAKAAEAGHATAADTAVNAEQLGGHPADYFALMKIGTSTVSFTEAAKNAGISVSLNRGIDGIERFATEVVPTLSDGTTNVIVQRGIGPNYGLWYYVLNNNFYCGMIISYFSELQTYRFCYNNGTYAVREI